MEEYYIVYKSNKNEDYAMHLFNEKHFSENEFKELVLSILNECKLEAPRMLKENMFRLYLEHKLKYKYGFSYFNNKKHHITIYEEEILKWERNWKNINL